MDILLSIAAGICLAAAAGFRVFVPLLILSGAAHFAHLPLSAGFSWLDSPITLIVLGVATLVEILAYYIPWVDNLLDTIAGPLAVAAGIFVMAAVVVDMPPVVRWLLAVIVGGGAAGTVQAGTTLVRGTSSATTAGAANPVVSTAELGGSLGASLLGVVLPVVGLVLTLLLLGFIMRRLARMRVFRRRAREGP